MTKSKKQALLDKLATLAESGDPEDAHREADQALVEFIGDDEVRKAFLAVPRWYA